MEVISFRIDKDLKKELEHLTNSLNSSQSQAIKDAIHAFYQQIINQEKVKKTPQMILRESGYIGSFEGRRDLSVTYKRDITKGLEKKHGKK